MYSNTSFQMHIDYGVKTLNHNINDKSLFFINVYFVAFCHSCIKYLFILLLLLFDTFHSGVLSLFSCFFSFTISVFLSLLIFAVVLDGFSLITLLPLFLGGSQAVLRCGVKACAKLAFHLCPKKWWWGLGVFSIVIPAPSSCPPYMFPNMSTSLINQITA